MKYDDTILWILIEKERAGTDYCYDRNDGEILHELCEEINRHLGYDLHYLAELDMLRIPGSGEIVADYIQRFSSEFIRACLLHHFIHSGVKDCDSLILHLYHHFRESDAYMSQPGNPSPAHITVRYDGVLKRLKPKKRKQELLQILSNPRDAFYLPFTARMLASWKVPEYKELLIKWAKENAVSKQEMGFVGEFERAVPSYAVMKRELRFTAIHSLKYYPDSQVIAMLREFIEDKDQDVRAVANKSLCAIMDKCGS